MFIDKFLCFLITVCQAFYPNVIYSVCNLLKLISTLLFLSLSVKAGCCRTPGEATMCKQAWQQ